MPSLDSNSTHRGTRTLLKSQKLAFPLKDVAPAPAIVFVYAVTQERTRLNSATQAERMLITTLVRTDYDAAGAGLESA